MGFSLSALSLMVVSTLLASAGIYVGLNRIVEGQRGGFACLMGGVATFALFVWLASPR